MFAEVAAATLIVGLLPACAGPVPRGDESRGPSPSQAVSNPSDPAALSQVELTRWVAAGGPGCTAAVGRKGKVVWASATGLADVERGTHLTTDSTVRIGSVSKQFTATAILLLQEQGKLSTADPVSRHLDGLPGWADRVTLAQLMHMSSGIPEVLAVVEKQPRGLAGEVSRRRIRRVIAGLTKLDFAPGTRWAYSSSNYYLLADVVERRSGRPFDAYLQEAIFAPAGLTLHGDSAARGPHDAQSYAYDPVNEPERVVWGIDTTGAGALRTTPSELVRWADNYRTAAIGGKAVQRAQLAGAVPTTLGGSNPSPSEVYGAGIVKLSDGRLAHNGGYAGFVSLFTIKADRTAAVAVTCNLRDAVVDKLVDGLEAIWF